MTLLVPMLLLLLFSELINIFPSRLLGQQSSINKVESITCGWFSTTCIPLSVSLPLDFLHNFYCLVSCASYVLMRHYLCAHKRMAFWMRNQNYKPLSVDELYVGLLEKLDCLRVKQANHKHVIKNWSHCSFVVLSLINILIFRRLCVPIKLRQYIEAASSNSIVSITLKVILLWWFDNLGQTMRATLQQSLPPIHFKENQ